MASIIAYLRVSTARQGISGLGLEAQRAAVEGFARSNGNVIVETFVEVESGKNNARPELAKALARCRTLRATLCVARLDRLARDLALVANMLRDGTEFVACDAPYANRLTLGILAAVAEDEGRRISERTKVALAAAKARGVTLGGFRGTPITQANAALGRTAVASQAQKRATTLAPLISELRQSGVTSTVALADALNAQAIPTARGGRWHAASVARMIHRLA